MCRKKPIRARGRRAREHRRDEHQLVVVNPDRDRPAVVRGDDVGEALRSPACRIPSRGRRSECGREVVEERPEDAVREAVVVARDLTRCEVDGERAHRFELALDGLDLLGVRRETSPGHPIQSPFERT